MRFLIILPLVMLPLAGQPTAIVHRPKHPLVLRNHESPFIASLREKATRGNAKAQFDLGVCYRYGQGVPQDDGAAVSWYRKAAEQGYPKAEFNLGVCYDFGKGIPQDHAEAVSWYLKAAEHGHAKAQYNLGVSCKYGQGRPRDFAEALAWFSIAASNGESIAAQAKEDLERELLPEELERGKAREAKLREELAAKAKEKTVKRRKSAAAH